ncbi:MAG TPA: hypothetical protein VGD43_01575 [Micromonospora sp.]
MTSDEAVPVDPGPGPVGAVEQVTRRDGMIEIAVRLTNPRPDRALHYISDPRGITVAPTGGFVVRLTDQGREIVPGATNRLPAFGRVDPESTALLTLRFPDTIVRMRVPAAPTDEVELERHEIRPESAIEIAIGWSDEPFYPDPRPSEGNPVVRWEKGQVRIPVPGPET